MTFPYPNTVIDRSATVQPITSNVPLTRTIPFDYVFQFELTGTPTNRVQDVVEISMQGVFVAVAIGYSFVLDERKTPRAFPPAAEGLTQQEPVAIPFPDNTGTIPLTFGPLALSAPIPGILFVGSSGAELTVLHLDRNLVERLIVSGSPPGPTFQDVTAPLSFGDTDRITVGRDGTASVDFSLPASGTIRVWDRTNNLLSPPIQIGSPVIGPDPRTLRMPGVGEKVFHVYGSTNNNVNVLLVESSTGNASRLPPIRLIDVGSFFSGGAIPPQFATRDVGIGRVDLTNKPLSPGDLLIVEDSSSGLFDTFTIPRLRPSGITLGAIAAGMAQANHNIANGFKVNPRFAALFAADIPLDLTSGEILASAFEPGCGADDITFLYAIDVPSTGRELQNRPIHNIAGLGISNGDRPFRPLARPIAFEPRTSIRIQVEEISTLPGTLYMVLQGYKTLGTGRIP